MNVLFSTRKEWTGMFFTTSVQVTFFIIAGSKGNNRANQFIMREANDWFWYLILDFSRWWVILGIGKSKPVTHVAS